VAISAGPFEVAAALGTTGATPSTAMAMTTATARADLIL
jgi:hypothetical protein